MNVHKDQWVWNAVQFAVLMNSIHRDLPPAPLNWVFDFDTTDDHERAVQDAADLVAAEISQHPSLYTAMTVLHSPDARVELRAHRGPQLADRTRAHVAVAGERGVVLQQQWQPDAPHTELIRLTCASAANVGQWIVGSLPECPRGHTGRMSGRASDLETLHEVLVPHGGDKLQRQFQRFVSQPRSSLGHIAVAPGPAIDHRPAPWYLDFHYMDYPDGRYLVIRDHEDIHIRPADTDEFAHHTQQYVNTVIRNHQQDQQEARGNW